MVFKPGRLSSDYRLPAGSIWRRTLEHTWTIYDSLSTATCSPQLTLFRLSASLVHQNPVRPLSLCSYVISLIKPSLNTLVSIVSPAIPGRAVSFPAQHLCPSLHAPAALPPLPTVRVASWTESPCVSCEPRPLHKACFQ